MGDLDAIQTIHRERFSAYEQLLADFAQEVRAALEEAGLQPAVMFRVKALESFVDKLSRLRTADRGAAVTDLLGIRVILPFLRDTELAHRVLAERFSVVQVEHKGADRSVQEFGYDSIHLLLRLPRGRLEAVPGAKRVVEIQIRTILQDAWAQIEHRLVYKADGSMPRLGIRRKLAAVNATLSLADVIFEEIRDHEEELRERGERRRAFERGDARPLSAPAAELTQLARPGHALRDAKSRELEQALMEALQTHSDGELERAVEMYGRILGKRQLSGEVRSMLYNHRGVAFLALDEVDGALRDFRRALRCDPQNGRAHYNLGLALRACGRPGPALRAFEIARERRETHAAAEAMIAELRAERTVRRRSRR